MPIKGLIPRFPRLGKMHVGSRNDETGKPTRVDYFLVKEDQSTPKAMADAFHEVYGDKPTAIDIMIPYNTLDEAFPVWFKKYGKSGLSCFGDGEKARELNAEKDLEEKDGPCAYGGCEHYANKKCFRKGQFKFMLPLVKGIGVWAIDTSGINSIQNITGGILQLMAAASMSCKLISSIPAKLVVNMVDIPYKVKDPATGEVKQKVGKQPILSIVTDQSLADILGNKGGLMPQIGTSKKADPPIGESAESINDEDTEGGNGEFVDDGAEPQDLPETPTQPPAELTPEQIAASVGGTIVAKNTKDEVERQQKELDEKIAAIKTMIEKAKTLKEMEPIGKTIIPAAKLGETVLVEMRKLYTTKWNKIKGAASGKKS